jgi:PAS domain S-box-containing protein
VGQVRAEAAEEWARLLIGSLRDYAVFMLDPDGHVLTWNAGAERAKGYRAEEIIGQHLSRFYLPEDRAQGRPQYLLQRALREGRVEDEGLRVRKDGTTFWADVIITPVRDAGGALVGFAKVTRDLTERKQAEDQLRESEERLRLLVDGVRDHALYMLDPEGRVKTWNPGAERIKGYRPQEILGQSFSRFYTPEAQAQGRPATALRRAREEGRYEEEGWRMRKDGTRFWAGVVLSPVYGPGGALVGYGKVTRDLTERRAAEEERLRLAHAEEAVRLRDEFLSIAAHELKTPLTALKLHLQSVRRRAQDAGTRLTASLDQAVRSASRLDDLIESLLDVGRLSTGHFELHRAPVDLGGVVGAAVERLRAVAERAECPLELELTPGLVGHWDPLRLEQLTHNLVGNALKYAAGTRVRVRVWREGDHALLAVEDGGPGVPPADLPRIFGRFERASSARHFGGLGLGLFVTRQTARAHGGEVEARNLPQGGAAFTVRLPLAGGALAGGAPAGDSGSGSGRGSGRGAP